MGALRRADRGNVLRSPRSAQTPSASQLRQAAPPQPARPHLQRATQQPLKNDADLQTPWSRLRKAWDNAESQGDTKIDSSSQAVDSVRSALQRAPTLDEQIVAQTSVAQKQLQEVLQAARALAAQLDPGRRACRSTRLDLGVSAELLVWTHLALRGVYPTEMPQGMRQEFKLAAARVDGSLEKLLSLYGQQPQEKSQRAAFRLRLARCWARFSDHALVWHRLYQRFTQPDTVSSLQIPIRSTASKEVFYATPSRLFSLGVEGRHPGDEAAEAARLKDMHRALSHHIAAEHRRLAALLSEAKQGEVPAASSWRFTLEALRQITNLLPAIPDGEAAEDWREGLDALWGYCEEGLNTLRDEHTAALEIGEDLPAQAAGMPWRRSHNIMGSDDGLWACPEVIWGIVRGLSEASVPCLAAFQQDALIQSLRKRHTDFLALGSGSSEGAIHGRLALIAHAIDALADALFAQAEERQSAYVERLCSLLSVRTLNQMLSRIGIGHRDADPALVRFWNRPYALGHFEADVLDSKAIGRGIPSNQEAVMRHHAAALLALSYEGAGLCAQDLPLPYRWIAERTVLPAVHGMTTVRMLDILAQEWPAVAAQMMAMQPTSIKADGSHRAAQAFWQRAANLDEAALLEPVLAQLMPQLMPRVERDGLDEGSAGTRIPRDASIVEVVNLWLTQVRKAAELPRAAVGSAAFEAVFSVLIHRMREGVLGLTPPKNKNKQGERCMAYGMDILLRPYSSQTAGTALPRCLAGAIQAALGPIAQAMPKMNATLALFLLQAAAQTQ